MEDTSTPVTEPTPIPTKKSRPGGQPRAKSRMPRPAFVVVACILILAVGWGAFSISGRRSVEEEDAELADLDSFESPAASVSAPDRDRPSGTTEQAASRAGVGIGQDRVASAHMNSWPTDTNHASTPPPLFSLTSAPGVQTATFESDPHPASAVESASGAWLLGIIEEDNAPASIPLPPRVASGLVDGPAFR